MPPPVRPNLFLVGAMKAGTTSLANYLNQHPEIDFCSPKEPNFFGAAAEGRSPKPPPKEDYLRLFASHRGRYSGDASVQYLYSEAAPAEIHDHDPKARILALLRNPIDRAFSHHQHNSKTFETRPFAKAIEDELGGIGRERFVYDWGYLELGSYSRQIERYLSTFGESAVRIFVTEDMDRDSEGVCRQVLQFLEVDPDVPLDTRARLNPSGAMRFPSVRKRVFTNPVVRAVARRFLPPAVRSRIVLKVDSLLVDKSRTKPMPAALRGRLVEHFAADVARLRTLTGMRFSEWGDW